MSGTWDREVDVVVMGSGAGALVAAVAAADAGCQVEILEKTDKVGGTSAFSGGMPWVPLNEHMAGAGVEDSREEALTYLGEVTHGRVPDPALLEVYVDNAAGAFAWIEANTAAQFQPSMRFSDYFADRPGGKPCARSLDTAPFDTRAVLGDQADLIRMSPHFPMGLTQDELASAGSAPDPRNAYLGEGAETSVDLMAIMEERQEKGMWSLGPGMMGGLLRGVLDRDITISLNTPGTRLVIEDGAVTGIVAEEDGEEIRIGARRGVVIASGGFEWNEQLVQAFMGLPKVHPLSPPYNTGDGLVMGLEAGAAVANMSTAWAYPVCYDGAAVYEDAPMSILATPRQEAGCITVNGSGRRFVNEGVTYMDFNKAFRVYDPQSGSFPNQSPAWMIFDQKVRDRIHIHDMHPGEPVPAWVHEADDLASLAAAAGVDPDGLVDEVARFNSYVDAGHDPDFGRGTVWWEGWTTGGPSPEKSMARIDEGPFYAMPLYDGILGTAGGLLVDEHARVRSNRGGVIPGLYAAGNAMASIFGGGYPGGGSTLGPGMTFGYLAGRHVGAGGRSAA